MAKARNQKSQGRGCASPWVSPTAGTDTQDKIHLVATQKQHRTFEAAPCVPILQAVKPSYILIFPGPEEILQIPVTETAWIWVCSSIDPRLTVWQAEEEMQEEELGPGFDLTQ